VKIVGTLLALALIAVGLWAAFEFALEKESVPLPVNEHDPLYEVIGTSVEGRNIGAHTYGDGATRVLFVGGIHGGYEWNSVLLAYRFLDYLDGGAISIPDGLSVTVVPSLNPDGVYEVIGKEGRFALSDAPLGPNEEGTGRFNARDVDLNRNFNCKWKPESTWRSESVSAGTEPFSEPEARALRDFVLEHEPNAVIFWHSQADAVYASECEDGILPETRALMNAYADASGYRAVDAFEAYEITGDAEGWLASIGIPAITVELRTHETIEWEENLLGIMAVLSRYSGAAQPAF
jgi:murein tripeptide amidase MpaA